MKDTLVVDRRDGLARVRIYPDHVQLFRSREVAETRAQEITCSKIPAWIVVVRETNS